MRVRTLLTTATGASTGQQNSTASRTMTIRRGSEARAEACRTRSTRLSFSRAAGWTRSCGAMSLCRPQSLHRRLAMRPGRLARSARTRLPDSRMSCIAHRLRSRPARASILSVKNPHRGTLWPAAGHEDGMHRSRPNCCIPGRGEPVRDGVVVLDGPGSATRAGPTAPASPGAAVAQGQTVMPGMWDCHGHFFGTRTFDLGRLPLEPLPLRGARCARDLRAALDAGITSVREVGGLGIYLARAVDEGVLDGPAIYAAGAILSYHRRARRPALLPAGLDRAIRPPLAASCGWPTGRTSACAPSGSSCAATRS